MVPCRETITRRTVGERKYVRHFDGRGHFAHLKVELLPRAGHLPSVAAADGLELPADCCHASRVALFKRFERGPIRGFPLIGLQVRLLAATYLPAYSYPDAFAAVASMAWDRSDDPRVANYLRTLGWPPAASRGPCALRNARYADEVSRRGADRDISWRLFYPRDGDSSEARTKSGFGSRLSSTGDIPADRRQQIQAALRTTR